MEEMDDILAEVREELYQKGYIDQKLLGNGSKKLGSFKFGFFFFGLKDGKLAIIPYADYKNVLYDEIKYYGKESFKSIKFSDMNSILHIKFADGGDYKYTILRVGKSDFIKIISIFDP